MRQGATIAAVGALTGGVATAALSYRYSKNGVGMVAALVGGTVFSWAIAEEGANLGLGLYKFNCMDTNLKFLDWWQQKHPWSLNFSTWPQWQGFEEFENLVWTQTCCHSPKCTSILNVCQVSPLFQKPTQAFAIHMLARGGSVKSTGCLGWLKGRGRRVSWCCSCRGLYIKVALFLAHSNELLMDT